MKDRLFDATECERCHGPLVIRTMSWFTEETICGECSHQETVLMDQLQKAGVDTRLLEGCGYIPTLPKGESE